MRQRRPRARSIAGNGPAAKDDPSRHCDSIRSTAHSKSRCACCRVLFRLAWRDGFRRLPVAQFWWPAIGALGFASVGVIVPRSLGVGYDQIGDVLNGRLAVGALAEEIR